MMNMVAEANYPSEKSKTGDDSISEVNMDENNGGSTCSMTHIPPQEWVKSIFLPTNFLLSQQTFHYQIFRSYCWHILIRLSLHWNRSHEGQNSENILENMTCGSLSANNPTIEASASDSPLGKSNKSLPGQHESLEAPVLSCETRAENELSPSTLEPLPEGVPGLVLWQLFVVSYGLNHTNCELHSLLIQGHHLLLHLGLGHQLKLRRARLLEKGGGHCTIRRTTYQQNEKAGGGLGED